MGATTIVNRPHAGGRPSSLTDEVIETLVDAVRCHQSLDVAASLVGVDDVTLRTWLTAGARTRKLRALGVPRKEWTEMERRSAKFTDRVLRALAESEAVAVSGVMKAGLEPLVTRKVTTKTVFDKTGEPHEYTETTVTEAPPDAANLRWWLERRSKAYRPRAELSSTVELEMGERLSSLASLISGKPVIDTTLAE